MKAITTIALFLLIPLFLQSQNTIDVSVTGFKNDKGKAMIGLYNTRTDFLKNEFKSFSAEIIDGKANGSFTNVPDGDYAISVYHDENDNGKLDFYLGFVPKEDYGNSNNVSSRFSPPKWEDALFHVKGNNTVQIDIEMK